MGVASGSTGKHALPGESGGLETGLALKDSKGFGGRGNSVTAARRWERQNVSGNGEEVSFSVSQDM